MDILSEFVFEIIIRRIIVGFFGYYTLLFFFSLFGRKDKLEWLKSTSNAPELDFGKGFMIGIVGLITITIIFILIGVVWDTLL